jgi:hypothetical protein
MTERCCIHSCERSCTIPLLAATFVISAQIVLTLLCAGDYVLQVACSLGVSCRTLKFVRRPSTWGWFALATTARRSNSAGRARTRHPRRHVVPRAKPVAATRRAWPWFALHALRNRKWATPRSCSYHANRQTFTLPSNGKALRARVCGVTLQISLSAGGLLQSGSRCFRGKGSKNVQDLRFSQR